MLGIMTILTFIKTYWKWITGVLAFCILFGIGFGVAWKLQNVRYTEVKQQLDGCITSFNHCVATNEENQKTITELQKQLQKQRVECEKRVNYYKKLLKQFQEIDNLTGGKNGQYSTTNCPDDVCNALNGMWR